MRGSIGHEAGGRACRSTGPAGRRRWVPAYAISAMMLAGGMAGLCLTAARVPAFAHDPQQHAAPEVPVELTFGRTEDYDYDPPTPGSYELPSLGAAADGILLDIDGRKRSLHGAMDGRITVLAFIYTRCSDPQGCPLSMSLFHDLYYVGEKDPAIGKALQLVTASFDPEHDTPEVLKEYMESMSDSAPDPARWLFLTAASQAALKPILAAYRQPIGRKTDLDDPFGPFAHQLRVYLIDPSLRIRNIYSLGFLDPRLVITDVRTLLLEEAGER
jgi:protein SCO1/2